MNVRKRLAGLILLCLLCVAVFAAAEIDMYADDPFAETREVSWRDLGLKKAQKLAVYGAPFSDAWRGAKGKAAVSTKEEFTLLGTLQGGTWGMIEYKVDKKSRRVGWIQLPEGAYARTECQDLGFSRKPFKLTAGAPITDDPNGGKREIRRLNAGETVIGMFIYSGGGGRWLYAETEIDGKTAWGFIAAEALEEDGPLYHEENGTFYIHEGVTLLGSAYEYPPVTEEDEFYCRMEIEPGDVFMEPLYLYGEGGYDITRLVLPSSLRAFGMEAIAGGILEELRLEGSVTRMDPYALYGVYLGRVTLAADYTGEVPDGQYVRIGEWKAEAGNPRYSDRDGVLYSADGKILIRYPTARTETHYDVPAGTEVIGKSAFYSDSMDIELCSVSLPIGLKRIEGWAFSGCGRLRSLTVPLTVTEVDETAFRNCVSLERLSLPPGMTAELGDWAEQTDFTWFNGDNGSTAAAPREKEEWETDDGFRCYYPILDTEAGSGGVPVYAGAYAAEPMEEMPAGTEVWVYGIENGRADISGSEEEPKWADLSHLCNYTGDLFFTATDAEITDPPKYSAEGRKTELLFLKAEGAVFGDPADEYYSLTVPYADVRLMREDGNREEQMGMIRAEDPAVKLTDAPDGNPILRLYFGTQARVLEERDGWLRIETGLGEGWILEESLIAVFPKE